MRIFTQACILFCCCIILPACKNKDDSSQHNNETATQAVTTAADTLATACREATSQSKMIFMKSGHPKCRWCRVFDHYHQLPAVRAILDRYFIVVSIDTVNMPDGDMVFSRYAKPGAPSWVIINSEKKVIIDSYSETGNVGYPLQPTETAHYLAAIRKTAPSVSEDELSVLSKQIQIAAEI